MKKEDIQDLAIQFATEGLDAEQQVIYDAWVISASVADKAIFTESVDLCSEVSEGFASQEGVNVPEGVKGKLLAEVSDGVAILGDGVKLVRKDEQEWMNLPVKGGARLLELSARKKDGFVMSMIEVQAGCQFPAHDHAGVEMAYILEGDLESDGVLLHAGDFMRADAGTHHGTHFSPNGCRALVVTSGDNYRHSTMKVLGVAQKALRKVKGVFVKS